MATSIKTCVGVILYQDDGRFFLNHSPKWSKWIVPGGKIEAGETEEEALRREIREELGIEITNLYRFPGMTIKKPSADFHDQTIEFHFIDFLAQPVGDIQPERIDTKEIDAGRWLTFQEYEQALVDGTMTVPEEIRAYVNKFKTWWHAHKQ